MELPMRAKDIMTLDPACCTPDTNLQKVAQLMVEHNCGCIPVVDDQEGRTLIGVITDRDITTRTVAEGRNPLEMTAAECMTSGVIIGQPDDSVNEIAAKMEQAQVRRIPIVDEDGCVSGIVAQADIVLEAPRDIAAEVVQEISEPASQPSSI
jgi:CBS domain-containing protein